jgi:outer membrane scaffolding protein for murein synthesis (MipA/OmpV family)
MANPAGRLALAVLGASVLATAASAQQSSTDHALPLWEFRLGGTALWGPDYPAADQSHWHGIAAPVFVYRGDRIRIGADDPNAAARVIMTHQKRFELDLSLDSHFGSDSDKNDARRGMPDLDMRLEIGPQLSVNFWDTGWSDLDGRQRVSLLLPVREVARTDFKSIHHVGFLFQPALAYRKVWPGDRRQRIVAFVGATWADKNVQDYFYEVPEAFVTPTRPRYDARAGYLGAHAQISGVREVLPGLNLYLTYRLSDYAGGVNEASPLFKTDINHTVSLSAVWTLARSKRPAKRPPD